MLSEEERKKRRKESWKRYYNANKKKLNDLTKQYREDNLEAYKEYNKNYNKDNKEVKKQHYIDNKEHYRISHKAWNFKNKYGITIEEYQIIFDKQEGKCNICGHHQNEFKRALCVDHDHVTGRIRGLLCDKCNRNLGGFNDDINMLLKAIEHLKINL